MAGRPLALSTEAVTGLLESVEPTSKVTEWLLEQRRLFGVPLTYKAAERERRRENKHSNACRRLDFASPLHKTGSRTPESIRNKRKRYRAKKKQLHRENVATSQGSINNEHHLGNFQIDMSEIPVTPKSNECSQDKATDFDTSQLPDTPISGECRVNRPTEKPQLPDIPISIKCKPSSHLPDTPISEASILNEQSSSDSSSSNWSRGPGSDRWDILLDEAERFRQQQSRKRAELDMIYGAFSDKDPSFPDDLRHLTIPKGVSDLDRVVVTGQLKDMLEGENKALFYARFYRDQCTDLQQRCRRLENEKEGIRYFWRNQVLEQQSRGGKMLLMATKT